jgi:WD40 repeat protein
MDTLSTADVLEPRAGIIHDARFEPGDRSILLACENGTVVRWRLDGSLEMERMARAILTVVAAPAGDRIAVLPTDGYSALRDMAAGGERPLGSARRVAFSPDGAMLAFIDTSDVCVLLDVATLEKRWSTDVGETGPRDILFAPDGESVLIVGRPAVLLDATDGSTLRSFGDHALDCERAAFSPDARRLCLAETLFEVRGPVSKQVRQGARIVDLVTGDSLDITIDEFDRDSPLRSIGFSPSGDHIVAVETSTGVPWLIDAATAKPIRGLGSMDDGRTNAAVFSPDGECVLSVAKELSIWQSATGELKARFPRADFF